MVACPFSVPQTTATPTQPSPPAAFPGGAGPGRSLTRPRSWTPRRSRISGAQLDSPAVAKGFARDYAKMWDQRYNCAGVGAGPPGRSGLAGRRAEPEDVLGHGGRRPLAQLAGELEDAVRGGDMDRASSLLGEVAESGSETVDELQFSYILWDS